MYGDYDEGGLRVPHIVSFCHALKMCWMKKLLDPLNSSPWKTLFRDKIETYGGNKIFKKKREGLLRISNSLNIFWKEIINILADLSGDEFPTTPGKVASQPIWYNNYIKIDNNIIQTMV